MTGVWSRPAVGETELLFRPRRGVTELGCFQERYQLVDPSDCVWAGVLAGEVCLVLRISVVP